MENKKYLAFGGLLVNQETGKSRYMSAGQVVQKYGADPDECILIETDKDGAEDEAMREINRFDYVHLRPRFDGKYDLEATIKEQKGE